MASWAALLFWETEHDKEQEKLRILGIGMSLCECIWRSAQAIGEQGQYSFLANPV